MVTFPDPKPFQAAEAARYAIYFAPPSGSVLHEAGSRWLGRDAISGEALEQPGVPGLSTSELTELTSDARHYGFHATMKPPFQLKPGLGEADLFAVAEGFAHRHQAFDVPLALKSLAGFLALMQARSRSEMRALAADCVRDFHHLRALPSPEELEQRREAGLSAQQENLLQRWGYPFVMDEFRFHMTLSKRLAEGPAHDTLMAALPKILAGVTASPQPIDAITIFKQADRTTPFTALRRVAFTG